MGNDRSLCKPLGREEKAIRYSVAMRYAERGIPQNNWPDKTCVADQDKVAVEIFYIIGGGRHGAIISH
jgi:hypothetical protein